MRHGLFCLCPAICYLASSVFSKQFTRGSAHATLKKPSGRNHVACEKCQGATDCRANARCSGYKRDPGCKETNPHSLQAGGPGIISARNQKLYGNVWPHKVGSHGLCGDPVQTREPGKSPADYPPGAWRDEQYMMPTPVQATYNAGDIVEFEINVLAPHQGHYEFRICDKVLDGKTLESEQAGEDCLNKWVLKRAPPTSSGPDSLPIDTKHPGRWYIHGDAGSTVQADWNDTEIVKEMWDPCGTPTKHKMRYIIPEDLSCEHCTMQWYWVSANKCALDADVGAYWKRIGKPALGATVLCSTTDAKFTGEEFWNCADIAVKGKGKPPSPPTQPPSRRRSSPSPPGDRRRSSSRRRKNTRRRSSKRRRGQPTRRRSASRRRKSSRRRKGEQRRRR